MPYGIAATLGDPRAHEVALVMGEPHPATLWPHSLVETTAGGLPGSEVVALRVVSLRVGVGSACDSPRKGDWTGSVGPVSFAVCSWLSLSHVLAPGCLKLLKPRE